MISILPDNAVSYTPAGGRVKLALSDEGRHHVIRVSDSGCGIPDSQKKKPRLRYLSCGRCGHEKQKSQTLTA
ncbi:MAG: ATP-binding protein [Ruminococcus sp.]|nr:ATP-binding protein [Ruminococcus sp.]